jgi:hypothetical protein
VLLTRRRKTGYRLLCDACHVVVKSQAVVGDTSGRELREAIP